MPADIDKLLRIIEQKLDWGDSTAWQSRDFENLQQLILDETGVSLSASTLRRVWGRVTYNSLPSITTLDTLARFAGTANWRQFVKEHTDHDNAAAPAVPLPVSKPAKRQPGRLVWMLAGSVMISLTLLGIFALKKTPPPVKKSDYQFAVKPVTRTIPNSVIFTYDAVAAPTDSVYIQQSWDKRRRTLVSKNQHTHTSVYYEPGFYVAKLVADNQVVKEIPLLIPTDGWLAAISKMPVPVYLPAAAFMNKTMLNLPAEAVTAHNIPLQPDAPDVYFYNVGNFNPVPLSDFAFSVRIKNEYGEGAAACRLTTIMLVTDDSPIVIPLSAKGCVSEIGLLSVDQMVSGKQADLSGFGVDFSDWVQVGCKSVGKTIEYNVNGKTAYTCALPERPVHIVGMIYRFRGAGAVKDINLYQQDKPVFRAFF
ncbi:hypothetical protein [Chitinophaga sp. GbtcB8]|uniref:hypothetical protein n=1 Tax=Chitinophaga sp. GbtcB8 TaxID=2824753 RepID=UPI001C31128C|nr:hypothetical protein [Chitinophaga sp. GbtcB8]